MIGRALGNGLRGATRRPGLVALLWAWNLALALVVTLPFWAWMTGATLRSPETDTLLDGVDIGILTQMIQASPGVVPGLLVSVAGLVMLSLFSGAFLSGGILEIVMNDGDGRPLLHRFFRGAGHFFGRFVRLLAIAGLTAAAGVGLVAAGVTAATRPMLAGGSEPASMWAGILVQAALGLAIVFFLLALDYARVMAVALDTRRMLRTWLRALGFVVRHIVPVAIIGLLAAVGVAATLAALAAYDVAYSARTWTVIAGAFFLQQAMAFARTAVRVGQIDAQATYCAGIMARARVANEDVRPTPVGVPAANEDVPPTPVGVPAANEDVRPTPVGVPAANEDVRPTPVGVAAANEDVRPTPVGVPAANEDVRPTPVDAAAVVAGDQAQQKE